MLNKQARETLRNKTVEVVLEMRASYLSTGVSALKPWDQIQDRLRASARTCGTVEEWATQMSRSLRLPAPSATYSAALLDLSHAVDEHGAADWLAMLDMECGYIMAVARRRSCRGIGSRVRWRARTRPRSG